MTLEEKKQIYLDRFPSIIGKRMAEQLATRRFLDWDSKYSLIELIAYISWSKTSETYNFWEDIYNLYVANKTIEHQQILDIFHKHNINP